MNACIRSFLVSSYPEYANHYVRKACGHIVVIQINFISFNNTDYVYAIFINVNNDNCLIFR